jgi:hypothetical protein
MFKHYFILLQIEQIKENGRKIYRTYLIYGKIRKFVKSNAGFFWYDKGHDNVYQDNATETKKS